MLRPTAAAAHAAAANAACAAGVSQPAPARGPSVTVGAPASSVAAGPGRAGARVEPAEGSLAHRGSDCLGPRRPLTEGEFWAAARRAAAAPLLLLPHSRRKPKPDFPLSRLVRIAKTDPAVQHKHMAEEVSFVLAQAASLFVRHVAVRAFTVAREKSAKQRLITNEHVEMALCGDELFDFLIDFVPRRQRFVPLHTFGVERTPGTSTMHGPGQVDPMQAARQFAARARQSVAVPPVPADSSLVVAEPPIR